MGWLSSDVSLIEGADFDPLIARYADEVLTECDSAIMHGPGHQSVSECIMTGKHAEHYSDMDHEWYDRDIGNQTWTRRRDGKVFRLASTGVEW